MKKKRRIVLAVFLAYILYVIVGMLAPFIHQKSVSDAGKEQIRAEDFYQKPGEKKTDGAKIVEGNQEALDVRLDMIRKAEKEIIISTFDIREGESTDDIFAALTAAAQRGVKVKILVDGLYGAVHMSGKEIFQAAGSHPNIEIRFYNTPNPLKPWTIHGCLHDKYLVTDDRYLLMGGRNMFDYFIGTHKGKSVGLDREILVVNTGGLKNSAVRQVKEYFKEVWNLDVCKTKFNRWSEKKRSKEISRLLKHNKELKIPDLDYETITVPVKKATLVTNPTHIYGKEPYVWETMKQLMLDADERVLIHTPYAVFSDEMYEGMKEVKRKVPDTTIILNSIASGDNICASADYRRNRQNILDTGVQICEYMGRHSTHGKSMVIDDDLAVVGSYNFDCRSTYVDTETMLVVQGKEIADQLAQNLQTLQDGSLTVDKNGKYMEKKGVKERKIDSGKNRLITVLSYIIQCVRYMV